MGEVVIVATMTAKMSEIAQELYNRLEANKATLGFQALYMGDQQRIATTPAIAVDTSTKTGTLKAAARVVEYEIRIFVIVYSTLIISNQINKSEADTFAEEIEDFLNIDFNLGGMIIHGFVESIESGYTTKTNSIARASRMTYFALTQNRLPSLGG